MIDDIINPVYMVGGCVRDQLLGKTPKDWDFATPILPDEIERLVRESGRRPYLTGKRFGTIGFKYDDKFVEVTTFRREQYGKTRKPAVEFVASLQQDLSRRDFTINAIALRNDKFIDPLGGQADITSKLIRAVGNPSVRFNEDPLRMLRAARFTAQLGFEIEDATFKSIQKNAHKILTVSKEWWMQELDKLLVADFAGKGIRVLYETDLMKFLLPELRLQYRYDQNSDWHDLALHEHSIATMLDVPRDINIRWAALLHDVGKPFVRTDNNHGRSNYVFHDVIGAELVYGISKRLKWSNERITVVTELVRNHLSDESPLRKADNSSKRIVNENL